MEMTSLLLKILLGYALLFMFWRQVLMIRAGLKKDAPINGIWYIGIPTVGTFWGRIQLDLLTSLFGDSYLIFALNLILLFVVVFGVYTFWRRQIAGWVRG